MPPATAANYDEQHASRYSLMAGELSTVADGLPAARWWQLRARTMLHKH